MENFLSDESKFQKMALKDDNCFNFNTSQEKHINHICKKLADSDSMSEQTRKHLKLVGTRPGIMYVSCKVRKNVPIAVHVSDQFYLLHKHQHTSLRSI